MLIFSILSMFLLILLDILILILLERSRQNLILTKKKLDITLIFHVMHVKQYITHHSYITKTFY